MYTIQFEAINKEGKIYILRTVIKIELLQGRFTFFVMQDKSISHQKKV